MSQKRIPILRVKWEDSCSNAAWASQEWHEKNASPSACESIGYLVTRNKKQISLAQSISSTGNITDVISIPRQCATSIEVIGFSTEPRSTKGKR